MARPDPAPYAPVPSNPDHGSPAPNERQPRPAACVIAQPGCAGNDSTPEQGRPMPSDRRRPRARRDGCGHTARDRARRLATMDICHPFSRSTGFKGWHARPREGDRDEHAAANSELDHPPERGVPRSKQRQRSDHQQTSGGPTHWRHRILTGHSGRVADTTVFVLTGWPRTGMD